MRKPELPGKVQFFPGKKQVKLVLYGHCPYYFSLVIETGN